MAVAMQNRVGEVHKTNEGYEIKIIDYIQSSKVLIEFQDEFHSQKWTQYDYCLKGSVKNPFHRTVYGVGFLGVGDYTTTIDKKPTKCYDTWKGMLRRCYDLKYQQKRPTYKDCSVCEEWHDFQNFAEWYEENYYEIENERMELDKDILVKGNKIYSPETCVFVPQTINIMFTKTNAKRGSEPIGVSRANGSYLAYCQNQLLGQRVHLGSFETSKQAFEAYKKYKEQLIFEVASLYKEKLPLKLLDALKKYEVEVTD